MSKVAFVTGGAGGIGAAICRALAADGHKVAVADLQGTDTDGVAKEIGGLGVTIDVTDLSSVKGAVAKTVDALGPVEICVNCAGWEHRHPLLEVTDDFMIKLIEINLSGVIRVTREVLPAMVEKGWGRIINVSSDTARQGRANGSIYSAAKAGCEVFTKAVAAEFGHAGITANVMSPGAFETPLFVSALGEEYEGIRAALKHMVPLGRVGNPSEAAAVVRFMASEDASYLTGQVISVNGGLQRT